MISYFLILNCLLYFTQATPFIEQFDVKPGGVQHDFEFEKNGVKCKFTYVCQGGTNEKWRMQLNVATDGAGDCTVERESGTSYLFFQSFQLSVAGAGPAEEAIAFGNGRKQLPQQQLQLDKSGRSVSQSASFGSEMAKVGIRFARSGRGDL